MTLHPVWAYRRWRRPEDAWFWTEAWQAGEHAAQADIDAGRVTRFESSASLLDALEPPSDALER